MDKIMNEKELDFRAAQPENQGLYHTENEKDACGVGFICNMDGNKSHTIIGQALEILIRLTHRGACGCDNKTGDGAGILLQLPHKFYQRISPDLGFILPEQNHYGTGMAFLPKDAFARKAIMDQFQLVIAEEGQPFLAWRTVPVDQTALGQIAARSEPHMEQVFIGRSVSCASDRDFERELFIIRKRMEKWVRESDLSDSDKETFYMPTLSSKIIIYKGLLQPEDFEPYYKDLEDPDVETSLALVHQRFSTNTFPAWKLAQPFRFLCHNGEINTVKGNRNWMNARQHQFESELFGDKIKDLYPICTPGASDSATLDMTLELLYHTGRELPQAMMMMVPEAWQNHKTMSQEKKDFYEYHSCLMEPWDGPALMPFTDGTFVGALLDRNGLRPARWLVTDDNTVVMASETGMIEVPPEKVVRKGRLQPGRMFLINMEEGRIVEDEEIKEQLCREKPYGQWLKDNLKTFKDLPRADKKQISKTGDLLDQQQLFGYSLEDLKIILKPMAHHGKEALGSMGIDTPLAVLSDKPQLCYNYFKQLFAQVTNPPLDAIREKLVTSLITNVGEERDLFAATPEHANLLRVDQPILSDLRVQQIRQSEIPGIKADTIKIFYDREAGGEGLESALASICANAEKMIGEGNTIIILSDKGAGKENTPIPALLATAAVHHHLIKQGLRTKAGIIVETGEARENHHFATLLGFGAAAINPYIVDDTLKQMVKDGYFSEDEDEIDGDTAWTNYKKAVGLGILKVMSKIGVSTLHSYRGSQIFEAVGLNSEVINKYFVGTASRIEGAGLNELAQEINMRHERAFPENEIDANPDLDVGGVYQWRRRGEHHLLNPMVIAQLQKSTKIKSKEDYKKYAALVNEQTEKMSTIRGLLKFNSDRPSISIDEVEPWTDIVKRFKTGAMSYGSISREAHETLAIAMNRLGGKSNSGEGGEEIHRYTPDANGDSRSSAIKQVASGRFGVTSHYLVNSKEIQIKMAQGAKPGEGGQLPGFKVNQTIAKARHSTPYVALVSPPPHHDIYSIEDLAQLIHDLKNANKYARVNVKLVSEVGVGTIAAGVSKGKADVVLIAGWDGGTGASPETSLKHCGLPWELGLSEAHQTLVLNDLRSRITVECDGKLLTGRDVAIACLLGAEEYGFSTAPLITMGCIMMRVCHLNTCPVGIATQRPELREKFAGSPDSVINFFNLVAEELREIMAELGFKTINEMIGQSQALDMRDAIDHYKAKGIDLSSILHKPEVPESYGLYCQETQDHALDIAMDNELIEKCAAAIDRAEPVRFNMPIENINRTVGTMLSAEISRKHGEAGLPEDTIRIKFDGSAGQSFAAFGAKGLSFTVEGDANDYFGKGLSGAKLAIYPPEASPFKAEENIIIGNVAFYGATAGEAFIRGIGGERFCVRNSGANTVIEGVGDHGCEYMTGGRVVVLGETGRNFAAGMSGGVAYILDEEGDFAQNRCNQELVDLEDVVHPDDVAELKTLIEKHYKYTKSPVAQKIIDQWSDYQAKFIKVMPRDYRKALERLAQERAEAQKQFASGVIDLAEKQD